MGHATPDGAVYDPSRKDQPLGFLEVKCPYSQRNSTPENSCSSPGFCCTLEAGADGSKYVKLKRKHSHFSQMQGQMGSGDRQWCDFVVFTLKGISMERVALDQNFWREILLPKLTMFYKNCVAPEIVSPLHAIGLPIRDLSKL